MPDPENTNNDTPPFKFSSIYERLDKVLSAVGEARERRQLPLEEVYIFLAVGHLGISTTGRGNIMLKSVSCVDVAAVLKIPRETVRRKAKALAKMNFVSMTSRGILLKDADEWRLFAEEILQ